ncbi:MAG: VCBS repeat-containing protein, partial [Verrucomicrobiales bacterium]
MPNLVNMSTASRTRRSLPLATARLAVVLLLGTLFTLTQVEGAPVTADPDIVEITFNEDPDPNYAHPLPLGIYFENEDSIGNPVVSAGAPFTATVSGGGTLTIDPALDEFGTPPSFFAGTVTVTASRILDGSSATKTFNVNILPVNDAPVLTVTPSSPVLEVTDSPTTMAEAATYEADRLLASSATVTDVDSDHFKLSLVFVGATVADAPNVPVPTLRESITDFEIIPDPGSKTLFTIQAKSGPARDELTPAQVKEVIEGLFLEAGNRLPPGPTPYDFTMTLQLVDVPKHNTVEESASDQDLNLEITSLNDAPSIFSDPVEAARPDGLTLSYIAGSQERPFQLAQMFISDPDAQVPGPTSTEHLSVNVSLSGGAGGNFLGGTIFSISNGGRTASVADTSGLSASVALNQLVYASANSAPSTGATDTVSVTVTDPANATAMASYKIFVVPPQTSPNIQGTQSNQPLDDDQSLFVFESIELLGSASKVRVSLLGDDNPATPSDMFGALEYVGPDLAAGLLTTESVTNGRVHSIIVNLSPSAADSVVERIAFMPQPNVTSSGATVRFRVELLDSSDNTIGGDATTSVLLEPVPDPPRIIPVGSLDPTDDGDGDGNPLTALEIEVFEDIRIEDPDNGGDTALSMWLQIIPSKGAPGTLTSSTMDPAFIADTTPGFYTVSNKNASEIETILHDLRFTPAENTLLPGRTQAVLFDFLIEDSDQLRGTNRSIQQLVFSRNDPPEIGNLDLLQNVAGGSTQPFSTVTISDPEVGAEEGPDPVYARITLTEPVKGAFIPVPIPDTPDVIKISDSVYVTSGAPDEVRDALRGLTFVLDGTAKPSAGDLGIRIGIELLVTDTPGDSSGAATELTFTSDQKVWVVAGPNDPIALGMALSQAFTDAGEGDQIVIAPASDLVPVTILLPAPVTVQSSVNLIGPGAGLMTIKPGWDSNSPSSMFEVDPDPSGQALFEVSGLRFSENTAGRRGGVVEVKNGGALRAEDCEFVGCSATLAGGAIAVRSGGSLTAERCLFAENTVGVTSRLGGGAVSIESFRPVVFTNCTFSENQSGSVSGLGGGAIYLENTDPVRDFFIDIDHCTFYRNADASANASSIFANVIRTEVRCHNSVFADNSGQTLNTAGGALIGSAYLASVNVIDDEARPTVSQGGTGSEKGFFDDPEPDNPLVESLNLVDVEVSILKPLADNGGTVRSHALEDGSPALGVAGIPTEAVDGRGVIRDPLDPDSGSHEGGEFKRLLINEVLAKVSGGTEQFVEIYNPRDSELIDPNGFQLRVAGSPAIYTISGAAPLLPGQAFVIRSSLAPILSNLGPATGTVELLDSSGRVIHSVSYLNEFGSAPPIAARDNESLVRAPEFSIGGLLPHIYVSNEAQKALGIDPTATVEMDSSGAPPSDVTGGPLDGTNAPPFALADLNFALTEDEVGNLAVLGNDFERDRTDSLRVVQLLDPVAASSVVTSTSGVPISISTDGLEIVYDPTGNPTPGDPLQSLREGEIRVDSFRYRIQDFSGAPSVSNTENYNADNATTEVNVTVTGVNDTPVPENDGPFAVAESSRLIIFADADNASDPGFDFGFLDDPPVPFVLAGDPPGTASAEFLLANDDDVDNDNNNLDLEVVGFSSVGGLTYTTACGATVTLDIRTNRHETHIVYDPTNSPILNSLRRDQQVPDSFPYLVRDRHGATAMATVSVIVSGTNDAPVAAEVSGLEALEGEITPFAHEDFVANDLDADSGIHAGGGVTPPGMDSLVVGSVGSPVAVLANYVGGSSALTELGATVSVVAAGVVYDPTSTETIERLRRGETILDTFLYRPSDGAAESEEPALVTVRVTGINDTPVAVADPYQIDEDTPLEVVADGGLLSNDIEIDIDGRVPDDSLRVLETMLTTGPEGAEVTINSDGSFSFDQTGNPFFNGLAVGQWSDETFEYTIIDNSHTFAMDDLYAVEQDAPELVLAVLGNDRPLHEPALPLLITSVNSDGGGLGTIRITGAGDALTYQPLGGFVGTDSFTYTIEDGMGGIDSARVSVRVVNDSLNGNLVANPDFFRVGKGTVNTRLPVLANDG